jgi:hypothetical protein
MTHVALKIETAGGTQPGESHQAAIGWAVLHHPTREAFRRATGEDISPVLDRYRCWLEENVIGPAHSAIGSEADD